VGKRELFLELAKPNKDGISRWVSSNEFIGKYGELELLNGLSWGRKSSSLAKEFNIEVDKSITPGVKIDRIRLNGYNTSHHSKLSQSIRNDIKNVIGKQRCIILGTNRSCDHKTEVDHKDGRKENLEIMNTSTQKITDFQPLSKPANDAKRQFCKECKETNIRYDAKKLGYTVSYTYGDEFYSNEIGCIGCFWYDPIEFRQKLYLI
jgi:hypothetical protein